MDAMRVAQADEDEDASSESTASEEEEDAGATVSAEGEAALKDEVAELRQLLKQERAIHADEVQRLKDENAAFQKEESSLMHTLEERKGETALREEVERLKAELAAGGGGGDKGLKKAQKLLKATKEENARLKAENKHLLNLGTEDAAAGATGAAVESAIAATIEE